MTTFTLRTRANLALKSVKKKKHPVITIFYTDTLCAKIKI